MQGSVALLHWSLWPSFGLHGVTYYDVTWSSLIGPSSRLVWARKASPTPSDRENASWPPGGQDGHLAPTALARTIPLQVLDPDGLNVPPSNSSGPNDEQWCRDAPYCSSTL
jgi:hypothetical protein